MKTVFRIFYLVFFVGFMTPVISVGTLIYLVYLMKGEEGLYISQVLSSVGIATVFALSFIIMLKGFVLKNL